MLGAGEGFIWAAECLPLLRSQFAGLRTDVLQRTERGEEGGGIREESDSLQRYLSIFARSCYPPTSPLLPSLSQSLRSHLKCLLFDMVKTNQRQYFETAYFDIFLTALYIDYKPII